MKLTVAERAGFCPGVRRADRCIRQLLADAAPDSAIFTLGHLIHNRLYNEELERLGVRALDFAEVEKTLRARAGKPTVLVIRTHGIPKEENDLLTMWEKQYENFRLIDMTCPSVKRIHAIAAENTDSSTVFLLYCVPGHPEAKGILSYARGEVFPFSDISQLSGLDLHGKTPVLCAQTTQNSGEFEKIKKIFKKLCTNAIFFDTICSVTENRQEEALRIAEHSDCMVVVGGRESSNTHRLYDLCRTRCRNAVWVESAAELTDRFLPGTLSIGITAGASTPDGILTEVINKMENLDNFSEMLEGSLKTLHTGDTVTGTVYTIDANEIKLDLGAKVTGVLTKEQITDDPTANLSDMFKVGDEVQVFVIRVEDGKGLATVSKKRVDADNSWVVLKDAHDNGTVMEGKVISAVKNKAGAQCGVLISASSNTVFVPASQTGIAKGGDLSVLVGTEQKFKVIEFDETKKRALGSIKVVATEERRAKEEEVWAKLEVGQHYMGTVKNLTTYGAFVDIGGVDGMVHNTELSWKRIKHPSQVVSVGQVIDVYIKDLDPEKKRISLGYKTQEMDSWYQFTQKYQVGDIVPAKIVSLMPFGAFAEVYDGVDGLIHISRISTQRVNSPADVLSVGQVVNVKITEIDNENRKLALSLRAVIEAAEAAARAEALAAEAAEAAAAQAEAEAKEAEERADMAPYIVGTVD